MKPTITYRTRRRLHRLGVALGYLILVSVLALAGWYVWLDRFVVYSKDGAILDFDLVSRSDTSVVAKPSEEATVAVHFNEGDDTVDTSTELGKIAGFYVTLDDLAAGVDDVSASIKQLPPGSAVILDLKSPFGSFYYSSKVTKSQITDQVSTQAVDQLIQNLTGGSYYAVASVPAFRDQYYGLHNDSQGLPHISGGYLWADEENCYWLNPTSSVVISRLIDIADELKAMGFDEVVFTEFRFPVTENIIFNEDKTEAIRKAAEAVMLGASNEHFAVSFASDDTSFPLPQGRSRLYLTDVSAAGVQAAAEAVNVPDKEVNLVFLTAANDTRFDAYSVVRPMPAAEMGDLNSIPTETEVPVMTQPAATAATEETQEVQPSVDSNHARPVKPEGIMDPADTPPQKP